MIWWPTWPGWLLLLAGFVAPLILWVIKGETFMRQTSPVPADVLVIEGWIGLDGTTAAVEEFHQGKYRLIVTSGGMSGERGWSHQRWNYADLARNQCLRLGIPEAAVIAAPARDTGVQRTFESALAVRHALEANRIKPIGINVFTLGVHVRRSRLIFAKVLAPACKVGAVSWAPTFYGTGTWWTSSERAKELITETAGFLFEMLFNGGRISNSTGAPEKGQGAI